MTTKCQLEVRLTLPNGLTVTAESLGPEERVAFIEFAIHLAAPTLARVFVPRSMRDEPVRTQTSSGDRLRDELPPALTVKETGKLLRVSTSAVYEMCRRWQGRFFPCIRIGRKIIVPRDQLIEWINAGGIEGYQRRVQDADREYERSRTTTTHYSGRTRP